MLQPGREEKRVLCIPCYEWAHPHNGQGRPAHITTRQREKLVCVTCETVSVTGWRWYSTPEGYECRKCHVKANILPKPRVCVSCNAESPDIFDEQLRMCGGCHERDRMARVTQTRSDECLHCESLLGKGGRQRRGCLS
ncbi:hypothetical protein BJX66DRAFT_70809 [Aspergillus keveii]|uniref:Uncharacterized protein n=1 Tax=Aspergillus keveii TaxID=714993 RepID=A0ABR4GFK8_9EURO